MPGQHRKTAGLTGRDAHFIADQIARGEYGNASEAVRAGLRLLEQERLRPMALRAGIAEGDADFAAGRFKSYKAGDLVREMQNAIPADEG